MWSVAQHCTFQKGNQDIESFNSALCVQVSFIHTLLKTEEFGGQVGEFAFHTIPKAFV